MNLTNEVRLIGHIGENPEVRGDDKMVTTFSLCTNDGWGNKEKANWHKIVCFGKLASISADKIEKGQKVLIAGSIDYNEYEGKRQTSILCRDLKIINWNQKNESIDKVTVEIEDDEDLPF